MTHMDPSEWINSHQSNIVRVHPSVTCLHLLDVCLNQRDRNSSVSPVLSTCHFGVTLTQLYYWWVFFPLRHMFAAVFVPTHTDMELIRSCSASIHPLVLWQPTITQNSACQLDRRTVRHPTIINDRSATIRGRTLSSLGYAYACMYVVWNGASVLTVSRNWVKYPDAPERFYF